MAHKWDTLKHKYPSCCINPRTEKPFTRHSWEIVPGTRIKKDGLYYYRVRCKRTLCGLNDPNPIRM